MVSFLKHPLNGSPSMVPFTSKGRPTFQRRGLPPFNFFRRTPTRVLCAMVMSDGCELDVFFSFLYRVVSKLDGVLCVYRDSGPVLRAGLPQTKGVPLLSSKDPRWAVIWMRVVRFLSVSDPPLFGCEGTCRFFNDHLNSRRMSRPASVILFGFGPPPLNLPSLIYTSGRIQRFRSGELHRGTLLIEGSGLS